MSDVWSGLQVCLDRKRAGGRGGQASISLWCRGQDDIYISILAFFPFLAGQA